MNINATIIGQSIAFAVFVWFCMQYVWPPIITALTERQKKIAEGLEASDRAERDLQLAQEEAGHKLPEAKSQAAEIIEQANKRANLIVEESKDQARSEGDRLKTAANAEIEQEANRAREALRSQVATLAVIGAEKILGQSIDMNAHSQLVDQLAAEL